MRLYPVRRALARVGAVFCLLALPLILAEPARADTPALSCSSDGGFTNGFTGTLGWEFTAKSTVNLTAFGFYNNGGPVTTSHQIGLWDLSGNLLADGTVTPSASATTFGYFDYSPITPFTLNAGSSYVIGALLKPDDFFYYDPSSVTTDPSIQYAQTQYDTNGAASLRFPQSSDFPGNGYGYFGPNFEVDTTQAPDVPEPNAPLALPLGLTLLAGIGMRRRAQRRCA